MPPSAALLDHLASNLTFLCPIWRMVSSDWTPVATLATAFGDSITKGTTGPSSLPNSYAVLTAAAKGWTLTNNAVDGSQAADQADSIYSQTVSGTTRVYWYAIGTNDQRLYLTDAGKLQVFKEAHLAEMAWLAIPEAAKIRGTDARWTYSSGWSTTVAYGLGKSSNTLNTTADVTVQGSTIYFATIVQDANDATFTVTVDGIVNTSTTSLPGGTILTLLGRAYAPRLIRISGLSPGSHSVRITVTSSASGSRMVYVDWITGNEEAGFFDGPNLYGATVTRMTAAGYAAHGGSDANVDTYNATIRANILTLQNDGLYRVALADFWRVIDPSIHTIADGLHINDAGNIVLKNELVATAVSKGGEAAFCAHTRSLTYNSVVYTSAPVEPTTFNQSLGVAKANHVELFGVFDTVVTEADVQGGRWKNAEIVFEYVNYLDLTMGSVGRMKGQAGRFTINNGTFRVELRSLSDRLGQEIGSYTSPMDRNRRPEDLGVNMTPFTHARTVTGTPPDRRNFTVTGTAQVNDYFQYGRAEFTSGANMGLKMEIKANIGNAIELQLPMRSVIANGDTVTLITGYDGSRSQARDKFGAMEMFDGEPDLPGYKMLIKYPE